MFEPYGKHAARIARSGLAEYLLHCHDISCVFSKIIFHSKRRIVITLTAQTKHFNTKSFTWSELEWKKTKLKKKNFYKAQRHRAKNEQNSQKGMRDFLYLICFANTALSCNHLIDILFSNYKCYKRTSFKIIIICLG